MRKQFYQTALENCDGLKLAKCRLQFKQNKLIVLSIIIFGTLPFPILARCDYYPVAGGVSECVELYSA